MDNISFAVGTGRCGTKFLSKVLAFENSVASTHEKHPLNDTFHRYAKWYNLNIDHKGFLWHKKSSINQELNYKKYSFEASAFLSLSIEELYREFNAKFILLVRNPEKVVNSYIKKGWYKNDIQISDGNKLPTMQNIDKFHHFLGRTLPRDEYNLLRWREMTRVGKLAWYWNALNSEVIKQFDRIPSENYLIVKLEDIDFLKYQTIIDFLSIENSSVSERDFISISSKKINTNGSNSTDIHWSDLHVKEFNQETQPMRELLGYEKLIESKFYDNIISDETKKMNRNLIGKFKNYFSNNR